MMTRRTLTLIVSLAVSFASVAVSAEPEKRDVRDVLGVVHVAGRYHLTDKDFLSEGADRHDSGVVDQDVERTELPLGGVEETPERVLVGDVELEGDDAAAELAGGLLRELEVQVADRDPRSPAHQRGRGRLADPSGAARDRDDLTSYRLDLLRHDPLSVG